MKISRILSIIVAFFMATTAVYATEKEVNGQPYVQLNNGQWMPRFGIGTFNLSGKRHVITGHKLNKLP